MPQVLAEIGEQTNLAAERFSVAPVDHDSSASSPESFRQGQDRESGWRIACANDKSDFGREVLEVLSGTRSALLAKVRDLNLPHIPFVTASVDDFLADPNRFLKELRGNEYYWMLHATSGDPLAEYPKPRVGSKDELIENLQRYAGGKQGQPFSVAVSECVDIEYLGNIVVNREGSVYGELTDAPYPPTRNGQPIRCRFARHPILDTFRYSNEDAELRTAIYNAIRAIPGDFQGRERVFDRGYYEFYLIRDRETNALKPAFYDFRSHSAFCYVPSFQSDHYQSTTTEGGAI